MTVLQVPPATMVTGQGFQATLPVVGGGGGGNKEYIVLDAQTRERRQLAKWPNANDGSRIEPPTNPAKFQTLPGAGTMRVVPYTVTGNRMTNDLKVFPRECFHCSVGYDYYLLQKMIDGRPRYWEETVIDGVSEERAVMKIVNG